MLDFILNNVGVSEGVNILIQMFYSEKLYEDINLAEVIFVKLAVQLPEADVDMFTKVYNNVESFGAKGTHFDIEYKRGSLLEDGYSHGDCSVLFYTLYRSKNLTIEILEESCMLYDRISIVLLENNPHLTDEIRLWLKLR